MPLGRKDRLELLQPAEDRPDLGVQQVAALRAEQVPGAGQPVELCGQREVMPPDLPTGVVAHQPDRIGEGDA